MVAEIRAEKRIAALLLGRKRLSLRSTAEDLREPRGFDVIAQVLAGRAERRYGLLA